MLVGDEDRDRDRHKYLPVALHLNKREAFGLVVGSCARAALVHVPRRRQSPRLKFRIEPAGIYIYTVRYKL